MTPPVLIPVMLAGGSGTRLWPVSRETFPKQLVRLDGESLLQQTARRLLRLAAPGDVVTVGSRAQGFLVRDQLAAVAPELTGRMLLEPVGRNTAAAVALAALYVRDRFGPEALLWVCPSDHQVKDEGALVEAVRRAIPAAEAGNLLTFGITPTRPETGFGYIQVDDAVRGCEGVFRVACFVEKPDRARAEAMIAAGGHHWNSGIFLFRADRILEELEQHEPHLLAAVEAAYARAGRGDADGGAVTPPDDLYAEVPSAPIDKAVMERSRRVAVVPCDPEWSDLGSWQAVWEQRRKDAAGNAVRGAAVLDDSRDCLIHAETRLVACAGLRDLAVIETADAVLVADRRDSEGVRRLVAALKEQGRSEAETFRDEQRPWGSFKVIHEGPGFKVKEIAVRPGGRLSLQSHRHRAEHWTVVVGTARVTVDDEVTDLQPNQTVHIPLGAIHRMENPGDVTMRLIEVQCGDYLGEDDIVRYEDVYGRS
jgi:mannose-1-phosphate guanylyltransferase / mannose-6-phosphate isomerase